MVLQAPDFEARTVESARRWTDDIAECDRAAVEVIWLGRLPLLRFVFDDPRLPQGSPTLAVHLTEQSKERPLELGTLVEKDKLKRRVRSSVEAYFKVNGLEITRKVFAPNAHV